MIGGWFVELVIEFELPSLLIVNLFTDPKLMLDGDGKFAVLAYDLLDLGSESIIGIDLLLNKSILPEVAIEDLP